MLFQIVDGCITNDGDAFLYGARTVYRDLCISGKVGFLLLDKIIIIMCERVTRPRVLLVNITRNALLFSLFCFQCFCAEEFSSLIHKQAYASLGMLAPVPANLNIIAYMPICKY